jgi:CBS-domain-containing membrane protein
MIRGYWAKMRGTSISPPRVDALEILFSGLGGFLGLGLVALLEAQFLQESDLLLLIAPFGASAVLIYGAVKSPLAQPRNLVGGHLLSAAVGVTALKLLGPQPGLAAAVAVSVSIMLMHATRTLHPPGGATALVAILGGPKIQNLGYLFVLMPVGAGVLLLLVVALLFNNLLPRRRYPEFWW